MKVINNIKQWNRFKNKIRDTIFNPTEFPIIAYCSYDSMNEKWPSFHLIPSDIPSEHYSVYVKGFRAGKGV